MPNDQCLHSNCFGIANKPIRDDVKVQVMHVHLVYMQKEFTYRALVMHKQIIYNIHIIHITYQHRVRIYKFNAAIKLNHQL